MVEVSDTQDRTFVFGEFTETMAHNNETCRCPLGEAFNINGNGATWLELNIAHRFDDIVYEKFMSSKPRCGFVSESKARQAWEHLLKESSGKTKRLAEETAMELGWSDLIEA